MATAVESLAHPHRSDRHRRLRTAAVRAGAGILAGALLLGLSSCGEAATPALTMPKVPTLQKVGARILQLAKLDGKRLSAYIDTQQLSSTVWCGDIYSDSLTAAARSHDGPYDSTVMPDPAAEHASVHACGTGDFAGGNAKVTSIQSTEVVPNVSDGKKPYPNNSVSFTGVSLQSGEWSLMFLTEGLQTRNELLSPMNVSVSQPQAVVAVEGAINNINAAVPGGLQPRPQF